MSESPPGVDLERLLPWFGDRVAQVGGLSATLVGHGRSGTPPTEVGGMRRRLRRGAA